VNSVMTQCYAMWPPSTVAAVRTTAVTVMALLLGGCGGGGTAPSDGPTAGCADVVGVSVVPAGDGSLIFEVTVLSDDTGWDQYADLWQVVDPDGTVLGERVLAHPHVDEQPVTRSQSGIVIPAGIDLVTVRAQDSVGGFCGSEYQVEVPR